MSPAYQARHVRFALRVALQGGPKSIHDLVVLLRPVVRPELAVGMALRARQYAAKRNVRRRGQRGPVTPRPRDLDHDLTLGLRKIIRIAARGMRGEVTYDGERYHLAAAAPEAKQQRRHFLRDPQMAACRQRLSPGYLTTEDPRAATCPRCRRFLLRLARSLGRLGEPLDIAERLR